jgi:hypothetical protein
MKVEGECRRHTEGVNLSGYKTSIGRASGETMKWRRRGKPVLKGRVYLSGKRTETVYL